MALATLQAIQTKVRRLTRRPSESQLTTTDLNNYINTFIAYDLPEHIRTFNLRQQFTFICNPYQDSYSTNETAFGGNLTNQLYNFQNKYLTIHPPVYIAGYQVMYSQSREQFYGVYPFTNNIVQLASIGDGVTTTFTGIIPVINNPPPPVPPIAQTNNTILQGSITFSTIDVDNIGLALIDVPVVDGFSGFKTVTGNLYAATNLAATTDNPPVAPLVGNQVNYITGAYTITFAVAPKAGQQIFCEYAPLVTGLPQAMLFYQNVFTLRPIPDKPYPINFEVYKQPTQLIVNNDVPDLEEWWQYIAYGASKKIFEDAMDLDSVNLILPEYRVQQNLVNRRTIVQHTNERAATIYTEQVSGSGSFGGWGSNGGAGW